MQNRTKALISSMEQKDQTKIRQATINDQWAWDYYMSQKEQILYKLVKNHCIVENGQLRVKSAIQEIDLDLCSPASFGFFAKLLGKAPKTMSYDVYEQIMNHFLSFAQTEGLRVRGYWRSSDYAGSSF